MPLLRTLKHASAGTQRSAFTPPQHHRSLLRPLGVVGYDPVEPAILAALATGEPLLLVSEHGAAKTLLLVRLAAALELELRHYNASILQFDDLAGFPIPDDRGGIRYASPPGAIWEAQVAFFDEIGRCRPEVANKLFPIVHERRLQGVLLDRLRFRWAATNPPPEVTSGAGDDAVTYEGVEALDPALADRFSYIVPLPRFADLSDADRRLVVQGTGAEPDEGARTAVRELVAATRDLIPTIEAEQGDAITTYVLALVPRLAAAGLATGGRRAATLRRNLIAVRAACLALGTDGDERACCTALLASIPDVVRRHVPRSAILGAHQAAWRETQVPNTDPRRVLLAVRDPLRRAALSLTLPGLASAFRGEALCGALAELPKHEAQIFAWHALSRTLDGAVPATAADSLAELMASAVDGGREIRGYGTKMEWAKRTRQCLAKSAVGVSEADYLHNVIVQSLAPSQSITGTDPSRIAAQLVSDVLRFRERCIASLGTSDVIDDVRNAAIGNWS